MQLDFNLHAKQLEVFNSKERFKCVAAGRRGGKSYLSAILLLINGLKNVNDKGIDVMAKEVWYIAPTFQQAKDIMWNLLKTLGREVIESTHENTAALRLINGRTIKLKGSDRPDTLRGVGISYVVLDEYAFMKPEVWDLIIRPTLADVQGDALFIGTPDGKNHFYDLWVAAHSEDYWEAFQFNSTDNPILDPEEIERARASMTHEAFRQEFEASFEASGGGAFKEDEFIFKDDNPWGGMTYIAVDPAGFSEGKDLIKSNLKKLDDFVIAVVTVSPQGWFVEDMIGGRWGVREASLQVVRAAQKYKPVAVGIEAGSLKNAVMPYLEDQCRRLGVYPQIVPVTHGGKKKTERILWSLQGRFQHGRIIFKKGSWNKKVITQLLDFPNPLAHDDYPDALAYIDQVSTTNYYSDETYQDNWQPQDIAAGY